MSFRIPTPRLPFAPRPNLTLFFESQVPSGEINPRSGNPILTTVRTEVKAMVAIPSVRVESKDIPGVNVSGTYCEGFILSQIPEGLEFRALNRVPATLFDNLGGEQNGDFLIQNAASTYGEELKSVAGIPLRGLFYAVGGG